MMKNGLIPDGFTTFGGRHCQTTSLRHVLAYKGLSVSKQMHSGLGRGIGFIYWYTKLISSPFVETGGGKGDDFLVDSCARIGIDARFSRTISEKKEYQELNQMLLDCWFNGSIKKYI